MFASLRALFSLHRALAAPQCIVIGPACGFVCVFVCGSVTTITRNCVHRLLWALFHFICVVACVVRWRCFTGASWWKTSTRWWMWRTCSNGTGSAMTEILIVCQYDSWRSDSDESQLYFTFLVCNLSWKVEVCGFDGLSHHPPTG